MADTKFGKLIKIEYDAAGNAFAAAVDIGELSDQTSIEPRFSEEDKNTQGEAMYSGQFLDAELVFYDLSKVSALQTHMTADTKIDVRFHFPDEAGTGTETVTVLAVKPQMVRKRFEPAAGRRNTGRFKISGFSVDPYDFDA